MRLHVQRNLYSPLLRGGEGHYQVGAAMISNERIFEWLEGFLTKTGNVIL